MSDKAALRRRVLEAMAASPGPSGSAVDAALQEVLEGISRRTCVLLGYLPLPGEPDVRGAMLRWQAAGGSMAIPATNWDSHTITPARVDTLDEQTLVEGRHGLLEPRVLEAVDVSDLAAVLVPGVAFDREGGRIGRGKGFYDRLLASLPEATPRIAICRATQLVDAVPMDEHDQRVHRVIVVQ